MAVAGLDPAFYARGVVEVAPDLIGCVVSHGGVSGIIVETEAYHDSEPACHAFVGLTPRTETLFGPPGRAYVYRSYGIHALLNAVCEPCGVGAAVLIRALEPVRGVSVMRARRGVERIEDLCSGPGKLTQALGVGLALNGADLRVGPLVIAPRPAAWRDVAIVSGPRIGITKAAELPWRFCAAGSRFVSGRLPGGAGRSVGAVAPAGAGRSGGAGATIGGRALRADFPPLFDGKAAFNGWPTASAARDV